MKFQTAFSFASVRPSALALAIAASLALLGAAPAARADPAGSVGASAATPPWAPPATEPQPRLAVSLGFGGGLIGGDAPSQGMAWRVGLGYYLTPRLQLAFDGDFVSFARYLPDASRSRQVGALLAGVHYRPFGDPEASLGLDLTNLELGVGIGAGHEVHAAYANLSPLSVEQGAWGPAAGASVAWLPVQGDGWHAGIELQAVGEDLDLAAGRTFSTSALFLFRLDLGAQPPPAGRIITTVY